jgi:hypothetical protein
MIFTKRQYYDTWITESGVMHRHTARTTSNPLVRFMIEYDSNGSILKILPWTKEAHALFYDSFVPFCENPNDYKEKTREFAVYVHHAYPRPIVPPKHPRASLRNGEPCVDPALYASFHEEDETGIREAKILFEIQRASRFLGQAWVSQTDIGCVFTSHLQADLQRLLDDEVIHVNEEFLTLLDPNTPLPAPVEKREPFVVFRGGWKRARNELRCDKKRYLTVSASGNSALGQPFGQCLVRLLKAHPPFGQGEVVGISSLGGGSSFQAFGANKQSAIFTREFTLNFTNPAASASHEDLLSVKPGLYDGVLIVGTKFPRIVGEACIRIAGSIDRCVVLDLIEEPDPEPQKEKETQPKKQRRKPPAKKDNPSPSSSSSEDDDTEDE